MGRYFNPGNNGFAEILRSDYVDKTGLIGLINRTVGTKMKLTCISRPRRFGKSFAAQMLCAYYDRSCDSHELFDRYNIARNATYTEHLNKYHVINIDVTGFISEIKLESSNALSGDCFGEKHTDENLRNSLHSFEDQKKEKELLCNLPSIIKQAILSDIQEVYPEFKDILVLNDCLFELVKKTKTKIVFIIDEWDSVIREAQNDPDTQKAYLNLLRGWFKNNNFTPEVVAAAYMTGILPIKKDGSQSAISDFCEYSMLDPLEFAEYVGFTEEEVQELCRRTGRSFESMKRWFDGYTVGDCRSIYNPYSVMQAITSGKYKSYWKKTSAAETLMTYIDMDIDGLQNDIARLIAGEEIVVDTGSFQNDVESFTCKNDVLTLLIHLGYLTYEEVSDSYDDEDESLTGLAKIPNEEVRTEFDSLLHKAKHKELVKLVNESDRLLADTIAGRSDEVAKAVQAVHESNYAPTYYNNEQSLRYVIKMAYISCVDQYDKVEELPSGKGVADVVFIPKRRSPLPAMIIELKWNKTSKGAIAQIKEKGYKNILKNYGGDVILAGINYDLKKKEHTCVIEVDKIC
ncbi:MAG: ATP-binding protein [Lachnospiraceae bacterium]|nr:ATP-binding protein [Lachnospiraceae bacterium]